jgi:hypothetical protein
MIEYTDLNNLLTYIKTKPEYIPKTGSYFKDKKGRIGEMGFARVIWSMKGNNRLYVSTIDEDKEEHWDFCLGHMKFDVKNNMTQNMLYFDPEEKFAVWIEFRNIYGGLGSCIGSSNFLSLRFKEEDKFIIVKRDLLVGFIERKMRMSANEIYNAPSSWFRGYVPSYKLYTRKIKDERTGRQELADDIIIKVPIDDIKENIEGTMIFSEGKRELFKKPTGHSIFF